MRSLHAFAVVLLVTGVGLTPSYGAEALSFAQESSLPRWVLTALRTLTPRVIPCSCLNPFYQRGDFDGDGHPDYAVMVKNPTYGKVGIAFIHSRNRSVRIIGAGQAIGNGGDDFNWMDAWQVFDRGPVSRGVGEGTPPMLRGDALLVQKTESASAIIWWDSKAYRWYQQGD